MLEKMNKTLKSLSNIAEYLGRFVVLTLILYGIIWVYNGGLSKLGETPVIEAPKGGVTEEFIQEHVSDTGEAKKVYQVITDIKGGKVTPTYSFPENTPQETVNQAVKNDGGDIVLSEVSTGNGHDGGTNIYSIHTDKSKHGVGIYVGAATDKGLDSVAAGIHVRNKRWVYQVGMTRDGGLDARVAYEVVQW